jgi:uncharacterized protein
MALTFFDANVVVGRPRKAALSPPLATPAELDCYLDSQALCGALVWHWSQAETHPSTGNALVESYVDVSRNLLACRTLLPPATDEPTGLANGLSDLSPGAVRLFPESHRYLMNRVVWDDLLDRLSEMGVPVLLSTEHGVGWGQIYDLLRDYPELTCVICDVGVWSMDRYTYPLLKAYPHVYVETSLLSLEDGGVEEMVKRFGAERLVFGTGFPKRYAEAAMLQLTHADIGDDAKKVIAADNMLRLIGGMSNG